MTDTANVRHLDDDRRKRDMAPFTLADVVLDEVDDTDDADYIESLTADQDEADELTPADPVVPDSFQPVDLAAVLAGDIQSPTPTILRRDDGQCLFYPGQVNGVHGDSGTGKGWVVLFAVAQQLNAGRNVLVIDAEDVAESILNRLRVLGVADHVMTERLTYIRPTDPFGMFAVDHLVDIVTERKASLVVVDSIGECFGLDGVDENHDAEVGPWLRRVARRLADTGAAVVLVDHSTKANDNPLHPSGSKRKRAAIGGASYLVTATTPLVAGNGGRLKLVCAKDRHGTYARGVHVADYVMTVEPMVGTRVELYAATVPECAADGSTVLGRRIEEVLAEQTDPVSTRTLRALLRDAGVKASNQTIGDTVELLVMRERIREVAGDRNARLFSSVDGADDTPEPTDEDTPET